MYAHIFQELQHGHPSFFRRYLQLDFLREQSTTDLPIIALWFNSNDNENVICDTNGPKEKICNYQALMAEANPILSINVIRVYIGGAVAWWLTPRTSDPEVEGSSSTRVAVLCPWARNVHPLPPQALVIPGKRWLCPNMTEKLTLSIKPSQSKASLYMAFNNIAVCILINSTLFV